MAEPKDKHLHIRWSQEDEDNLKYVMIRHGLKKSDAVRLCVEMVAEMAFPKIIRGAKAE